MNKMRLRYNESCALVYPADTARQSPLEAVRRSILNFDEKHYALMRQRNIIGQVCNTPKSYDNVMHVGLRKVTFKWQRGNKIGEWTVNNSVHMTIHSTGFLNTVSGWQVKGSMGRFTHASMWTLANWWPWRRYVKYQLYNPCILIYFYSNILQGLICH